MPHEVSNAAIGIIIGMLGLILGLLLGITFNLARIVELLQKMQVPR